MKRIINFILVTTKDNLVLISQNEASWNEAIIGDYTITQQGNVIKLNPEFKMVCDTFGTRLPKVYASLKLIEGLPQLRNIKLKNYVIAYNFYKGITDSNITYNTFLDKIYSNDELDVEFSEWWKAYTSNYEIKHAMLWAANKQTEIIQRGFWLEPNSFDANNKVLPESVLNDRDINYGSVSYKKAGNYVSTYGSTIPDFDEYFRELEKPYDRVGLFFDDNNSTSYSEWTLLLDVSGYVEIATITKSLL